MTEQPVDAGARPVRGLADAGEVEQRGQRVGGRRAGSRVRPAPDRTGMVTTRTVRGGSGPHAPCAPVGASGRLPTPDVAGVVPVVVEWQLRRRLGRPACLPPTFRSVVPRDRTAAIGRLGGAAFLPISRPRKPCPEAPPRRTFRGLSRRGTQPVTARRHAPQATTVTPRRGRLPSGGGPGLVVAALPLQGAGQRPPGPAVGGCQRDQPGQRLLGPAELRRAEVGAGEQFDRGLVLGSAATTREDAGRLGGLAHGEEADPPAGTPSAGRSRTTGSCRVQPRAPPAPSRGDLPATRHGGITPTPAALLRLRAVPSPRPAARLLVGRRPARPDARRVRGALAAVPRLPGRVRFQLRRADHDLRHLRARPAGLAAGRRRPVRPRRPSSRARGGLPARGRVDGAVPRQRRRRLAARRPHRPGTGDRRPDQHAGRRR